MNIAYFRKSKNSLKSTINNLIKEAEKDNWKILGQAPLQDKGSMILLCRPEWVNKLLNEEHQLIGFLPCSISVFKKNNEVLIGTGQPSLIKTLSKNEKIHKLATKAEKMIHNLIHKAAGVKKLKPEKVTLYSTMSCPYCKMEESWLKQNNIEFETKYVDLNPQEAEKMVKKTGQMGVPVTEIQYQDADAEYIVGFVKEELANILNIKQF